MPRYRAELEQLIEHIAYQIIDFDARDVHEAEASLRAALQLSSCAELGVAQRALHQALSGAILGDYGEEERTPHAAITICSLVPLPVPEDPNQGRLFPAPSR